MPSTRSTNISGLPGNGTAGRRAAWTAVRLPAVPIVLALALGILFSGRFATAGTTDSPVQLASYTTGQYALALVNPATGEVVLTRVLVVP